LKEIIIKLADSEDTKTTLRKTECEMGRDREREKERKGNLEKQKKSKTGRQTEWEGGGERLRETIRTKDRKRK
jgi:hypothetical protein